MDRVLRITLCAVPVISLLALTGRAAAEACTEVSDLGSQLGNFSGASQPLEADDCDAIDLGVQSVAAFRWVAPASGTFTFFSHTSIVALRDETCACPTLQYGFGVTSADLVEGQEIRLLALGFADQQDATVSILRFGDGVCTLPVENWFASPDDCPLATFSGTISWNSFEAQSGYIQGAFFAPLTGVDGDSANYTLQTVAYTPSPTVGLASCPGVWDGTGAACADIFAEVPGTVIAYSYSVPVVFLEPGETRTGVDFTIPDVPFRTIDGQVEVQGSEVTGGYVYLESRPINPVPELNDVFIYTVVPIQPDGSFTATLTQELRSASYFATVTTTTCAKRLVAGGILDPGFPEGELLEISIVPPSSEPSGAIEGTVSIPFDSDFSFVTVSAFNQEIFEEDCAGGMPSAFHVGPPGPYSLGPLTPGPFLMQAAQTWFSGATFSQYFFAPRTALVASSQTLSESFAFSPAVVQGTIDLLSGIFGPNATFAQLNGSLTATGDRGDSLNVQGPSLPSLEYALPLDPTQHWNLAVGLAMIFFSYPPPEEGAFLGSSIFATLSRQLPVSGAGAQPGPTENDLFRPAANVTMSVPVPAGVINGFAAWTGRRTGPDNLNDSIGASGNASVPIPSDAIDLRVTLLPGKFAQESSTAFAFDATNQTFVPLDMPPMAFDVDAHDVVSRTTGSPDLADLLPGHGESCAGTSSVSGVATAVRGDVASVAVNGAAVSAAGGPFHATIVSPIGRHAFSVTATNTLGEGNVQQRTVIRPFTVRGFLPPGVPLVPADQGTPPTPTSAYKAGSTIPLKVQHLSCGQLVATSAEVAFGPRIVSLEKIGNQAPATVIDPGSTASNDGSLFRYTNGGTWVNNLKTKGWSAGIYLITVEFTDGRLYRAAFALR